MPRRPSPLTRQGRVNRRGCFALLLVILLVLIALAAIGFNADPINEIEEENEDNNCIASHIRLSGMEGPDKKVDVLRVIELGGRDNDHRP